MNSPVIAPQGSLKRKYFESYDKADMIPYVYMLINFFLIKITIKNKKNTAGLLCCRRNLEIRIVRQYTDRNS